MSRLEAILWNTAHLYYFSIEWGLDSQSGYDVVVCFSFALSFGISAFFVYMKRDA